MSKKSMGFVIAMMIVCGITVTCATLSNSSALDDYGWVPAEDPSRMVNFYRNFSWQGHSGGRHILHVKISFDDLYKARMAEFGDTNTKLEEAIRWVRESGILVDIQAISKNYKEPIYYTVVNFVQSIHYTTSGGGVVLPAHLLASAVGDCDDKSYLAAALLHELHYDVALADIPDRDGGPGHMAIGVVLPDVAAHYESDGKKYTYSEGNGKKYMYWEVTHEGWSPGNFPESLKLKEIKLIYLPNF